MTKGYRPPLDENTPKVGGVYRHYKGDLYEVTGLAIESNDDVWMVVYKPLYENADADLFVQPVSEWLQKKEFEGKTVDRFTLTSE